MKFLNNIFLTLLLFFGFSLSVLLLADDAAGFVRVSVESNAEAVVEMPYSPLHPNMSNFGFTIRMR